jgi:hypothetical protein
LRAAHPRLSWNDSTCHSRNRMRPPREANVSCTLLCCGAMTSSGLTLTLPTSRIVELLASVCTSSSGAASTFRVRLPLGPVGRWTSCDLRCTKSVLASDLVRRCPSKRPRSRAANEHEFGPAVRLILQTKSFRNIDSECSSTNPSTSNLNSCFLLTLIGGN